MNMGNITKKAIRIGEDWNSFLNEHSDEIQVIEKDGKIIDITLPVNAENKTLVVLNGEVAHLEYFLGNNHVRYTSPSAHKSKIYELVEEFNKKLAEEK